MSETSRFIIGIDLGTTNTTLAYVDTAVPESDRRVEVLPIPQLTAPGEVSELPVLPSFIFLPEPGEIDSGMLRLPWHDGSPDFAVGAFAREMAPRAPGRVVSSAKSWLCVSGVDRRAPILPYDRRAGGRRISPVDAARLVLEHLQDAWNWTFARENPALRIENQQVYLTVPASFDAVARQLTVEAAEAAGLQPVLIEEPLAAFYAWLLDQGDAWRDQVTPGETILVCDIGGGTTDFTLIAVRDVDGNLELERVAVGDHILLGGDNMDLTLSYRLAERLQRERGMRLDPYQVAALTHACRKAKEELTGEDAQPRTLTVLGRGSGVVGGAVRIELTPEDVHSILLDGFFPTCSPDDRPAARRRVGLRTLGLDYASDPAVTRHLAAFLADHAPRDADGRAVPPDAVLFNGGVTRSPVFRRRIVEALEAWAGDARRPIRVLEEHHPDLATAVGAAWYGHARSTGGIRIRSGSARSYYIGIEASMPAVPGFEPPLEALCVVHFGMEEGTRADVLAEGIGLIVGETTEFRFFASTRRLDDQIGDILESWAPDELEELPPLTAYLPVDDPASKPPGTLTPVRLESVLTEVGVLQLWCHEIEGDGRWKLEFDLRAADPEDENEDSPCC